MPSQAADSRRAARVARAFAEVYRLRRRFTTEAERLEIVSAVLGEPIGGGVGRSIAVTAARVLAEDAAVRLVRRARRRQVVVSAVVAAPVAVGVAVEVLARR